MRRLTLTIATTLIAATFLPGVAGADGLPLVGVDAGGDGVVAADSAIRYVALPAGRDTVVAKVEREGGRVAASRLLRGAFAVPLVAFDGSASGLAPEGRTLVLIRPRLAFPRQRTGFAVLDTRRLRLREEITLRGDFSFDALSPNGRWLYLVEYLSPK
jgi:hypothetical protein